MTSGLKTRNPLVLFEGNDVAVSRPVARNPIVQADVVVPQWTPKKPVERNPLFGDGYAAKPVRASVNNNKVARNPIVADPREFAIKGDFFLNKKMKKIGFLWKNEIYNS